MGDKLSVIIPAYNEEQNIEKCVLRVKASVKKLPHEIIIVNDGSKDRTKQVASKIKGTKLVSYDKNRGKGHAVRLGFRAATGNIVIVQDADMATPPEEIEKVIRPIVQGKADFVNTSRLIYPMEKGAMKTLHVFGNRVFAFIVSVMIGQKLTDTLSGFKAFRKGILENNLEENSWPDFELLLKAKKYGMRIAEVPIHYKSRKSGLSKMRTFSHGYKMLNMLVHAVISDLKNSRITGLHQAETYDIVRRPEVRFHFDKYRKMFENVRKNKNCEVLELGCGTGIYTKFLCNDFKHVTAVDSDPKMIEIAKERAKCKFLVSDVRRLPFKNSSFDIVTGVSILHHIADRRKVFRDVKRILKPGGYFVFAEPNKLNPMSFLFQRYLNEDAISRFEAKRLIKENSLKEISVREIMFRNPFGNFLGNLGPIEGVAEGLHMGITLLIVGQKVK